MSEKPSTSTIDSVAHIVRELKVGGLPAVAWTVVVCCALLKQDNIVLSWLWPYLFKTWIVLIAGWVVISTSLSLVEWWRARKGPVPVIADPVLRAAAEHRSAASES
jgi:hypothetical protein